MSHSLQLTLAAAGGSVRRPWAIDGIKLGDAKASQEIQCLKSFSLKSNSRINWKLTSEYHPQRCAYTTNFIKGGENRRCD